jgi:hypothetical protein
MLLVSPTKVSILKSGVGSDVRMVMYAYDEEGDHRVAKYEIQQGDKIVYRSEDEPVSMRPNHDYANQKVMHALMRQYGFAQYLEVHEEPKVDYPKTIASMHANVMHNWHPVISDMYKHEFRGLDEYGQPIPGKWYVLIATISKYGDDSYVVRVKINDSTRIKIHLPEDMDEQHVMATVVDLIDRIMKSDQRKQSGYSNEWDGFAESMKNMSNAINKAYPNGFFGN